MSRETELVWKDARVKLRPWLVMDRVENLCDSGMPDVYYEPLQRDATPGWLELKCAEKLPARPMTPVFGSRGLRTSQINWADDHPRSRIFVLARFGNEMGLYNRRLLFTFNGLTIEQLRIGALVHGIQDKRLWEEIARILLFGLS